MKDEHPFLEGLEGLHDLFELEVLALFIRPKCLGDSAIGAEQDDQPLPWPRWTGQSKTGQTDQERQRRGRETQLFDELAALDGVHRFVGTIMLELGVFKNSRSGEKQQGRRRGM